MGDCKGVQSLILCESENSIFLDCTEQPADTGKIRSISEGVQVPCGKMQACDRRRSR